MERDFQRKLVRDIFGFVHRLGLTPNHAIQIIVAKYFDQMYELNCLGKQILMTDKAVDLDSRLSCIEREHPKLRGALTAFPFGTFSALQIEDLVMSLELVDFGDVPFVSAVIANEFSSKNMYATMTIPDDTAALISQILGVRSGSLYCPALGIGVGVLALVQSTEISGLCIYGQESNPALYSLARLNFIFRGHETSRIFCSDPINDPITSDDRLQQFDYVFGCPPSGHGEWGRNNFIHSSRYSRDYFDRFTYGVPTGTNYALALILHSLAALKDHGKAAFLISEYNLFCGGQDKDVRKGLIEDDLIESVIELPQGMLGQATPPYLVVFNKSKPLEMENRILFINATNSRESAYSLRVLREQVIQRVRDAYFQRTHIEQFSRIVEVDQLSDYSLKVSRYIPQAIIDVGNKNVRVYSAIYERKESERIPLNKCGRLFRGISTSQLLSEGDEAPFRFIKYADVKDGQIQYQELQQAQLKNPQKFPMYQVVRGDLLVSRIGNDIKTAVVESDSEELIATDHFICLRPNGTVNTHFIKMFLDSPLGQYYLRSIQTGTSVKTITPNQLGEIMLPLIPVHEQDRIATTYVDAQSQRDKVIRNAEKEFETVVRGIYEEMGISDALGFGIQ